MVENERKDDNTGDSGGKSPKKLRVLLRTFGCQMNIRDSEVIAGILIQAGFELRQSEDDADVVILNTCAVREHAEEKVWSEIGSLAKRRTKHEARGTQNEIRRTKNEARGTNEVHSPWSTVHSKDARDQFCEAKKVTVTKSDSHLSARTENREPRTASPIIGLVGCMAKNYGQAAFTRSPFVDFVVGPQDIAKIPEILQKLVHSQSILRQAQDCVVDGRQNRETKDEARSTRDEKEIEARSIKHEGREGDRNRKQENTEIQRTKQPSSILFERKIWETDGLTRPEEIYHSGFRSDTKKAYIVISEGCSNYCSYCVVPYVRGQLRHRRQEDILREAQEAASKGITEIFLLGQNVNSYRSVSATGAEGDFVDLLEAVHALEGVSRISFISSHPKDSNTRLFKAIAGLEKVKKSLHLPFQSGSDHILKSMNRGYNSKYYLELAREYRKIVPGGELSTDIIVGFPGESEEDFQATYRMVEDVRFDSAFIFKYSPRPHSKAVDFSDDVEKHEKERRHKLILDLQKRVSLSARQRREAK